MNRHFIFAGIFMLLGLCAAAQPADSTAVDSLWRIGDVDTGPVTMRRAADGDNMVLEVAGFGITIGPSTIQGASNRDTKSRPRVCGLFFDGIEMGFNFLTGSDYAGYPAGTGDFLDVRGGNSFHFGVTPVGMSVRLDKRGKFEFSTGLRYTVDNYRLSDNSITLGRVDGLIVPVPLDEKADKSKFRTTSLGIPLQFSFDPVRRLRVYLRAHMEMTDRYHLMSGVALRKHMSQENSSGPMRFIKDRRRKTPSPGSIPSSSGSEARSPTADSASTPATA